MERLEDFEIGKKYISTLSPDKKQIYTCIAFNSDKEPLLEWKTHIGSSFFIHTIRPKGVKYFEEYKEPRKLSDDQAYINIFESRNGRVYASATKLKDLDYFEKVLARAELSWDEENGFSIKEIK